MVDFEEFEFCSWNDDDYVKKGSIAMCWDCFEELKSKVVGTNGCLLCDSVDTKIYHIFGYWHASQGIGEAHLCQDHLEKIQ